MYLHSDGKMSVPTVGNLEKKCTQALFVVIYILFVYSGSHQDGKNIERAIQCTKVRGS